MSSMPQIAMASAIPTQGMNLFTGEGNASRTTTVNRTCTA
jgi:hypothetical protein